MNLKVSFSSLKKICLFSSFLKLLTIPIQITISKIMSNIVAFATDGKTEDVLKLEIFLTFILVVVKIFHSSTDISYQKMKSKSLHKCKLNIYKTFLLNPLSVLYGSNHGESIEKFNDDFNTATGKIISLIPDFSIAILTVLVYSVFLAFQNIYVALILLTFAVLQLVPPIIVKEYMQINYDNCREIEAQITDFVVEGYRGFATIKLYGLKKWWINKLANYHKKYINIGNLSIYTSTTESTLNLFISTILKYGTYTALGLLILLKVINVELGIQAIALSSGLFSAVKTIFSSIPSFAVAKVAESRLSEWFAKNNEVHIPLKSEKIDLITVTQTFGEKTILKETNVSFPTNKICVIRGASGIGKSTLFKLIVGILPSEYGNITVGGIKPRDFPNSVFPKVLFYLPQDDATFDFTPYMLYKMIDDKLLPTALKITKEFNLTKKQTNETKINELSGGERKKVYLSLAFALSPSFLLLDEPTNSLDEESKKTLLRLLKQRDSGALIITHDTLFDDIGECFYRMTEGDILIEKN